MTERKPNAFTGNGSVPVSENAPAKSGEDVPLSLISIPELPSTPIFSVAASQTEATSYGRSQPQPAEGQPSESEVPPTEPRRRVVDTMPSRVSLIPRFVIEVLRHPFKDFTLVKGGSEVFVAERGAKLSGKDLSGVNLRGADLEGANLERALLTETNLEAANLAKANLKNAVLAGANLRGANLHGATLTGADFRRADLWGAAVSIEALSEAMTEGALLDRGATPE